MRKHHYGFRQEPVPLRRCSYRSYLCARTLCSLRGRAAADVSPPTFPSPAHCLLGSSNDEAVGRRATRPRSWKLVPLCWPSAHLEERDADAAVDRLGGSEPTD